MKIVYNAEYGGFFLGSEEMKKYAELSGLEYRHAYCPSIIDKDGRVLDYSDIHRNDPILVKIIEDMKENDTTLRIKEIPDSHDYRIDEYDGLETVVSWPRYTNKTIENLLEGLEAGYEFDSELLNKLREKLNES